MRSLHLPWLNLQLEMKDVTETHVYIPVLYGNRPLDTETRARTLTYTELIKNTSTSTKAVIRFPFFISLK